MNLSIYIPSSPINWDFSNINLTIPSPQLPTIYNLDYYNTPLFPISTFGGYSSNAWGNTDNFVWTTNQAIATANSVVGDANAVNASLMTYMNGYTTNGAAATTELATTISWGEIGTSIGEGLAALGTFATSVTWGAIGILTSGGSSERRVDDYAPAQPITIAPPISTTGNPQLYEQYALVATRTGLYPTASWGVPFRADLAPKKLMFAGEVWKYGTTKNGVGRYTNSFYTTTGMGLDYVTQFSGTLLQVRAEEATKIINYYFWYGDLPPGNKCLH